MTWEAIRQAVGVAAVGVVVLAAAAGLFWGTVTVLVAVFGGVPAIVPSPVPMSSPSHAAVPAGHLAPPPHRRPLRSPHAWTGPVSAVPVPVPVRTRHPARTVAPSPAPSTLRPAQSPAPLRSPPPAPSVPPTATTAPPTATPTPTPTPPGVISGSGT